MKIIISFCSPVLTQPSANGILPGSAVFVPSVLRPEHPDIFVTLLRNPMFCFECLLLCKFHHDAIVSVYRFPSTSFTDFYYVMADLS